MNPNQQAIASQQQIPLQQQQQPLQQDPLRVRGNHAYAYLKGDVDTIDVIRAKLDPVGYEGYCFGMVHKRLHRAAAMRPEEHEAKYADWLTAAFYLNQLLRLEPPSALGNTADRIVGGGTGDFLAAFDRLAVGNADPHARTHSANRPLPIPPRAGDPQQQR